MKITLIKNNSNSKILNTDENKKVEFKNIDIQLQDFANIIANNFVLSRPLVNDGIFQRKSEFLNYDINCGYILLDLDKITRKNDFNQIIQYFRNTKWECIICNSRSYNYVDNFNLKVLIKINYEATDDNLQRTLLFLKEQLQDWCFVDESSVRNASYQAPSMTTTVFYINTNNIGIPISILPEKQQYENIEIVFNDSTVKWCYNYIVKNLGGKLKQYENNYSVTLPSEIKSKGSYYWYTSQPFTIFHPNPKKIIQLLSEYIKTTEGKEFIKSTQENIIKTTLKYTPDIIENKQFINNIDLPDKRVIMVKSAMGTGKSNIVKQYINNKSKVLFISVRQTLAKDISIKYNCKHYIDDKDLKFGDNYVVQINSLHKINLNYFDYVVLDEFESLLMYFVNSVKDSKFIVAILRKFNYILKTKKLLILDALLSDHTDLFPEAFKYLNEYKNNSNIFVYNYQNLFFSVLENTVATKTPGTVITMSFSTLNELNTIKNRLINKGIKCVVITSDTNKDVRDNVFMDYFNKETVGYDCILFSPSITVGLSILNNVTHHFHFDNSNSVDSLSSLQMIRRARKATNIHIFVDGYTNSIYIKQPINETLEYSEIPDLEQLYDTYKTFCRFYNTIELNHKLSFNILLDSQFNNITYINNLTTKPFDIERPAKDILLEEFENSPIKDELLKTSPEYIKQLRNFLFYIKTKDYKQFLENYLTSNPNNLIESSDKVKFIKLCIDNPHIKLKTKFIKSELNEDLVKLLLSIGYKQNNSCFYLPHTTQKHLNALL